MMRSFVYLMCVQTFLLWGASAGLAVEPFPLVQLITESAVSAQYATAIVAQPGTVALKPAGKAVFPRAKFSVPQGTLDLSAYQFVTAEIENCGTSKVTAALWVCASGGWHPVNQTLELSPKEKAAFNVNLRLTWSDGKPRLDPRRITHIQLVLNKPDDGTEVRLSGLAATGTAPAPFVVPADRLVVPDMTEEKPAPGKRVREKLPAYTNTAVYHALYLPVDWKPGVRYPVIVEYSGNEWYGGCYSTGLPEGGSMGYGMSQGLGYIWVNAPCLNKARDAVQTTWWDEDATADYAVALVRWICETYGGDPGAVFLTGFSRGGHACTGIGLHNDTVAGLWLAFHACQGFESSREALQTRMPRLRGRPVFMTDNDRPEFRNMFPSDSPVEWAESGLHCHSDVMMLDNRPSTAALRKWMQEVTNMEENTAENSAILLKRR